MFRKVLFIYGFFLFLFLTVDTDASKGNKSITAQSAILISSITKKTIYSRKPHLKLAPASTVKIMTALVVLEHLSMEDKVRVSRYASSIEPSKIYIKEGELYKTEDLLKAVLLNSGNDASTALAESVAGTEKDFIAMMNRTANRLGAKSTNFRNSNGLPAKNQYSTASDLSLLVQEAMKHKEFIDILKLKDSEIKELSNGRWIKLRNHNKSLWKDKSYLLLGKTGYTKKAGHCFAGYIQYNKWRKVIVVILNSKRLWSDLDLLAERGRYK